MRPQQMWQDDPIFIEVGVRDASVASSICREGYSKYLGVSDDDRRIAKLQRKNPELADQLTYSKREKLVRNNNANVLILSGLKMLYLWKYRSVRHADSVAWRLGFDLVSLFGLLGCLWHMTSKSYAWPRIVAFRAPGHKTIRLWVSRVLRPRLCNRKSLHFIPHELGLTGVFRQFDMKHVQYVVLRWFESLPEVQLHEDVDLLVADDSLSAVLSTLQSLPGILPCDVYSETGLARSDYCGTPYYPAHVASKLIEGRVRHKDLFMVPKRSDYFHSLAYHAVYHKGTRSNLDLGTTGLRPKGTPGHDYAGILRVMADELDVKADISLEGLHTYLQESGWGPSPVMIARLSMACRGNKWLGLLSRRLEPHIHDQGLAVFALRQEAVQRGFQDQIVGMIEACGFEILATKRLSPEEMLYSADRTRGGNWKIGPFDISGGLPAIAVIAYDAHPLSPNRRQLRKFPQRTNARIFAKETIRDAIMDESPPNQRFNAIHSSDYAAEAWHLLELYAPELMEQVRRSLGRRAETQTASLESRQAA
jgi:hypothetical protein